MGKPRTKLILEFDNDKRKEYLTGFRKRKNERRRKAQLEMEQKVKNEKARIRKKRQDAINQRLEEITNIKLQHDIEPSCIDISTDTLNLPHHNVTIVESELFDPALNIFVGDNNDDDDKESHDDKNELEFDEEPKKKFDVGKGISAIERLKKKQQIYKKNKSATNLRKPNKATKKLMRKKKRNRKAASK